MASSSPVTSTMILFFFLTLFFSLHRHGVLVQAGRQPSPLRTQMVSRPNLIEGNHIRHFAGYEIMSSELHGAKATLSVSKFPSLSSKQQSSASIFVSNGFSDNPGESDAVNSIEVGWHASPELYGDTQTRFFIRWEVYGGEETPAGCYNLDCPGFVLIDDSPIEPGQVLNTDIGLQKTISLTVYQDLKTRDWWLVYSDQAVQDITVGRWPNSLFTSLVDKANAVKFGGEVYYVKSTKSPPMGNGHFPAAGDGKDHQKAAYMAGLQCMDGSGSFSDVLSVDLTSYTDVSCYNTTLVVSGPSSLDMYYGGPGGCGAE